MTNPEAAQVAAALRGASACLIATHINPEGDAIGSMLALALALEQHGVQVTCYDRDGVPEICRFLHTWERVVTEVPAEIPPLLIIVDADRPERCNLTPEQVAAAQTIVRVDHHITTTPNLGPALVDTHAAAAGELVFALLPLLDARMTPEIATCLMAALMVDTGRFCYSNTTPRTHQIAAELLEAGADVPTITEWTWGRVSFASAKLHGYALSTLQLSPDGRISWAVLRSEDYRAAGADPADTEGIIDSVRNVKDVDVAALFTERNGAVRVSLRSRGPVDVAAIARKFKGGGHVKAAGITYDGTLDAAVCAVLDAIREALGA